MTHGEPPIGPVNNMVLYTVGRIRLSFAEKTFIRFCAQANASLNSMLNAELKTQLLL
jgi:hypothetical protein